MYVTGRDGAKFGGFGEFGGLLDDLSGSADVQASKGLQKLLEGVDTKNIPDIIKKAEALANKHLGVNADKGKKAVYEFLYMQARQGIELAKTNKYVQEVDRYVTAGVGVAGNVGKIVDKFKTGKKIDASGVADIASLSHEVLSTFVDLSKEWGLSSKAAAQIKAWSNVAVGCASSVASMGPYVGAAACGISVVQEVISMLSSKSNAPPGPKAIFVPHDEQSMVAAMDASRLAHVLRYSFKVAKYQYIWERMKPNSYLYMGTGYPGRKSTQAIPAVDLRSICAGMCFWLSKPNHTWISGQQPWWTTNHVLYYTGDANDADSDHGDREAEDRYTKDHDVNVQTVVYLAHRYVHNPSQQVAMGPREDWKPGLVGFVNTNYLLNFFTALTLYELQTKEQAIDVYMRPNELPVRLYAACDTGGDCRSDWEDEDAGHKPYGKWCWTNMSRCGIGTDQCDKLFDKVYQGDLACIRELASIRLMAAFSYMHMVYNWSGYRKDMVAELPSESDPATIMEKPVNSVFWPPSARSVEDSKGESWSPGMKEGYSDWQQVKIMLAAMKAKNQKIAAIAKIVEAVAKEDDAKKPSVQISQEMLDQFKAQMTSPTATGTLISGAGSLVELIKSGQLDFNSMLQARHKCRTAGGDWMEGGAECSFPSGGGALYDCKPWTASSQGKKYYCVPKGTPGAGTIDSSGEVSKAPGVGTILTIAGAGLLLMRLLKA